MRGLYEQYDIGGIRRLVAVVEARANLPGSSVYLVTTVTGVTLAGNVADVPTGTLQSTGWSEITYKRSEEGAEARIARARARLRAARRLPPARRPRHRGARAASAGARRARALWPWSCSVIIGVTGGVFIARRVLRRIDGMTATSDRIMAGDLSGRLPVAGSGDEFDRLASSLNAMLERIEALMVGLKHVSDNIAHDLKTPLTRLKNRAEEALRTAKSDADYRAAIEKTIEESDGLIRTFDALLMIARAEAGQAREHMTDFDAADIAESVAELYEPLAEEQGLALKLEAKGPLPVHGSRELIGQALANLIDNAIKYGKPDGAGSTGGNRRERARRGRHGSISRSPTTARVFRSRIACACSSVSCGWRPAAPSPAPDSACRSPPRWRGCTAAN